MVSFFHSYNLQLLDEDMLTNVLQKHHSEKLKNTKCHLYSNITSDIQNVKNDNMNITSDTMNITSDTTNITSDTMNITTDIE